MAGEQLIPGQGLQDAAQRGGRAALGIVLVWVGGFLLFIAFMSGKTGTLTVGRDQAGKPQGPRDASELVSRLAEGIQAAQGGGAGPGPTAPGGPSGGIV